MEKQSKSCTEHQDMLNVYCLTCQKLICATCKVFGDCQNCTVIRLEQAYEQQQQELRETIRLTTSATDGVQSAVSHCEDLRTRTRNIGDETLHTINAHLEKLSNALEQKRSQLLKKVQKITDQTESIIGDHQTRYTDALNGANLDVNEALRLGEEEDQVRFLQVSRNIIDRMMKQSSDMQVRPPPVNAPNPTKWRLDVSGVQELIRKIDFGESSSRSKTTSVSGGSKKPIGRTESHAGLTRNEYSQDSLDETPMMSMSMVDGTGTPTVHRAKKFAPVNVPSFKRGSFTIPASTSHTTSTTSLANQNSSSTHAGGLEMISLNSIGTLDENNEGSLENVD